MSGSWQLGALMKKNLILMKRSCCATVCEIFFPMILMILLVLVRRAIKVKDHNEPIVDLDYLKTNSTILVSPSEISSNLKWNNLTFRNPL